MLIVGVVFASTALAVGSSQYGFGLFIAPLEATFGWSRTQISASLSFAAVSGLAAPFLGRAMDRYGARPILVLSLGISGAGFALRPWMSELWHWYALSFLQFVAFAGTTVLPSGKLVATWYPRTRGRVMAIAVMGNNAGGLVVPPAIAAVLAALTWREGYLALALASFVLALLALLVVREHPPPGATPGTGGRSGPGATDASRRGPAAWTSAGMTVREAVRTRAFYAVLAAVTLGSFTYSTLLPHLLSHFVNAGMTVAGASFTLGSVALAGIFGKLGFGLLAERVGARWAAVTNLVGQALFTAGLALAAPAALVPVAPLFGIFMGGFGVLIALLVQDTFGLRHFGSLMGLVNTSTVVSFGLGPLMAGVSYDVTGGYAAAFVVAAILFAAGAAVLATIPLPRTLPARPE